MKTTSALMLSLLFLASGCPASDDEVLAELGNYADAICACDSEACVRQAQDAASRNPVLIEANADDPILLKKRLGDRFTPVETRIDQCLARQRKATSDATPSALPTPKDTNDCLTRDNCTLACPDGGKQIETPNETHCKKDGKLHGLRLRWYANGRRKQRQLFRHETPQYGFTTSWYENGQKRHEQSAEGTRDWYETGEQKAEFIGGQLFPKTQDGVMTEWFKNGTKKTVQRWKNGKEHGEFLFFYENGQESIQSAYVEGKYHGSSTTWHENGQMSSTANYTNDKLDGAVNTWHPNGQKKIEAQYKEDKLLSETCWDEKGAKTPCPKP